MSESRQTQDAMPSSELVERITSGDTCLAYVIRSRYAPTETTFLTPPEYKQQVGYIVYPAGGKIRRHVHRSLKRELTGTSEVLVVRQGRCEIDIYDDDRKLVCTRELQKGDVVLMVSGGHGFRMLEPTVFLEIKQGPYIGTDEKECF